MTAAGRTTWLIAAESKRPTMTWYLRISASFHLFSGLTNSSRMPAGSLSKAASVGAKSVNGPGSLSVGIRSAAVRARISVVNCPLAMAVSTISCAGTNEELFLNRRSLRDQEL
jgi:hypothetical protein